MNGDAQDTWPHFSSALRDELTNALNAFMDARGAKDDARLRTAAGLVCAEAHALHWLPEHMVIALKQLYANLPGGLYVDELRRREAFDQFIGNCIVGFFMTNGAIP